MNYQTKDLALEYIGDLGISHTAKMCLYDDVIGMINRDERHLWTDDQDLADRLKHDIKNLLQEWE